MAYDAKVKEKIFTSDGSRTGEPPIDSNSELKSITYEIFNTSKKYVLQMFILTIHSMIIFISLNLLMSIFYHNIKGTIYYIMN